MGVLGATMANDPGENQDPSINAPEPAAAPATSSGSSIGGILAQTAGGIVNAATGGLLSGAMSAIFGGAQDKRQQNQQQALDAIQVNSQEQLASYQQQLAMQTWNQTSYPAQVQKLEEAGLNPALLYGKGGSGGQLMSFGSGGVAGASAPSAGEQTQANAGMGLMLMQQKQAEAQINLMNAQAAKTQIEAVKEAGADTTNENTDTTLKQTQTASLTQGIQNQQAQQALTEVQTNIAKIQEQIQGETAEDQIAIVAKQYEINESQAISAMQQANVDSETVKAKIDMIQEQTANALLQGLNIKANTSLTEQQTITEQFKAGLTKMGISPDAPWYVKTIGDLAAKLSSGQIK